VAGIGWVHIQEGLFRGFLIKLIELLNKSGKTYFISSNGSGVEGVIDLGCILVSYNKYLLREDLLQIT
jgi:hypothetical protein